MLQVAVVVHGNPLQLGISFESATPQIIMLNCSGHPSRDELEHAITKWYKEQVSMFFECAAKCVSYGSNGLYVYSGGGRAYVLGVPTYLSDIVRQFPKYESLSNVV